MDQIVDHPAELTAAAQAWGIETEYWDVWGKQHHAAPQVKQAILKSLGVGGLTDNSLEQALQDRAADEWRRPLDPTIVVSSDQRPHYLSLSLAIEESNEDAVIELRLENSEPQQIPIALS